MNTLSIKRIYNIDEELLEVTLDAFDNYKFGDQEVLSEKYLDLTKNMEWYDQGYDIVSCDGFYSRDEVYFETSLTIKKIINNVDINNLNSLINPECLEEYKTIAKNLNFQ